MPIRSSSGTRRPSSRATWPSSRVGPRRPSRTTRRPRRLAGHRPLPYVSMGSVLLQMGRAQEAIAAYDEALARAPTTPRRCRGKAAALLAAGKRSQSADARCSRSPRSRRTRRASAPSSRRAPRPRSGPGGPERLARRRPRSPAATATPRPPSRGSWRRLPGYQQHGHLDAALDACQRALGVSLGAPAAHLQMARIYFQRGWDDRGVERLLLLDRLPDSSRTTR